MLRPDTISKMQVNVIGSLEKKSMNSKELGKHYNKIAEWWTSQMKGSDYGMKYVQKAMRLAKENSKVLDIGCGSTGKTIDEALKNGFDIIGIDVSAEMIRIAKKKHPDVMFTLQLHKMIY
jgi:ubiquinone/menaquinone biosynthesis C-methylase UbiE